MVYVVFAGPQNLCRLTDNLGNSGALEHVVVGEPPAIQDDKNFETRTRRLNVKDGSARKMRRARPWCQRAEVLKE